MGCDRLDRPIILAIVRADRAVDYPEAFNMIDTLSLWRSPLDKVALAEAEMLRDRQPRCSIVFAEDISAMTIYNYGYYTSQAGATPDTALTAMFLAMHTATPIVGGAAFIPQVNFAVHASSGGFAVPDQCNVIGAGGGGSDTGTHFYHFSINNSGNQTFFNCAAGSGGYTSGGKYFRGLAFFWVDSSSVGDTCIYAATWNCRAIDCTFTNCPVAFNAQGQSCVLKGCTIDYASGPNDAIAVVIAGSNCGVLGPSELRQFAQSNPGAPTGCTCISIQGPADHTIIADAHISDWNVGIDFSQLAGSQNTCIVNCEIQCWQSALNIQLPADAGTGVYTTSVKVTNCTLAKTNDNQSASPCVLIDAQLTAGYGNTNAQLSDITLLNCTVYNQATSALGGQHGLEILGGQNVKIVGGTYSNNTGAGIAVTGACGDVQIIGANLQPTYNDGRGGSGVNLQQYGLLVSGNPTGTVLVSGCDMNGYTAPGSAPVMVVGRPNQLLVFDCPGYNDQSAQLNGNVAPTGSPLSAAMCTTPYFGPSVISFVSASPVPLHIFGQVFMMSFGVIFLPSPYDDFFFGSPPSSFTWTGQ